MRFDTEVGPRDLSILLLAAALFFTANAGRLSLLPLDDCHYAQKGVEMAERQAFFTVTFGGERNTQHAPLQPWILSRSFAILGENDFAARLPSILMALGVLVCGFDIGRRTVGTSAAVTAVALLLTTNTFLQNARRCMLEVPTAFWVALFFVCYLRGLEDRRWHLALAVPLAAGILTKSVVGLMPLPVLAVCSLVADLRPRSWPVLAAGIGLGLLGGSAWTWHQGMAYGWEGMREHYFKEVGNRSLEASPLMDFVIEYPRVLLREFQPVVVGGVVGAVLAVFRWRSLPRVLMPAVWVLVWLGVANLSSARISRYVFATLLPMALLSGWLLWSWMPRASRILVRAVVPVALLAGAVVFWVAPQWLSRDLDAPFKEQARTLQTVVAPGTSIPLLGEFSWRLANPLLYYGKQEVGLISHDVDEVVAAARRQPRPVLLVEKSQREALSRDGIAARTLVELPGWELVEIPRVE